MVGPSYEVLYPDVEVSLGDLTGPEGNVYAIIGNVTGPLRRAHGSKAATEFTRQATSQPSYEALLELVHRWVTVVG